MATNICLDCASSSDTRVRHPVIGSICLLASCLAIGIHVLSPNWQAAALFFIGLGGAIYGLGKTKSCKKCGSSRTVPDFSPIGRKLLAEYHAHPSTLVGSG
jgi:hypothetical protein